VAQLRRYDHEPSPSGDDINDINDKRCRPEGFCEDSTHSVVRCGVASLIGLIAPDLWNEPAQLETF
jgi:hypothetical protein